MTCIRAYWTDITMATLGYGMSNLLLHRCVELENSDIGEEEMGEQRIRSACLETILLHKNNNQLRTKQNKHKSGSSRQPCPAIHPIKLPDMISTPPSPYSQVNIGNVDGVGEWRQGDWIRVIRSS